MKNRLNNHELKREIGFFSATVLVIANMIGTGIFTTSGFIIEELGNPLLFHAHGVRGKVDAGGMVVTAEYDDGEPMSYARVKISAPGTKLLFQSGRTDRNGRFCFFPDTPGDWQVVVNDEMGHRLEVMVPVGESKELMTKQQTGDSAGNFISRYEKALMGISIIFGISGIFFWWKGKRIYSKMTSTTSITSSDNSLQGNMTGKGMM